MTAESRGCLGHTPLQHDYDPSGLAGGGRASERGVPVSGLRFFSTVRLHATALRYPLFNSSSWARGPRPGHEYGGFSFLTKLGCL
jgi:hypothetical protein